MSIRYTERLTEASIEASVGNVGDSYAYALCDAVQFTTLSTGLEMTNWGVHVI